jgi:hypothetical protein
MNMPVYKPILAVVDERETPKKNSTGRPEFLFLCPPDRLPASEIISQRLDLVSYRLS